MPLITTDESPEATWPPTPVGGQLWGMQREGIHLGIANDVLVIRYGWSRMISVFVVSQLLASAVNKFQTTHSWVTDVHFLLAIYPTRPALTSALMAKAGYVLFGLLFPTCVVLGIVRDGRHRGVTIDRVSGDIKVDRRPIHRIDELYDAKVVSHRRLGLVTHYVALMRSNHATCPVGDDTLLRIGPFVRANHAREFAEAIGGFARPPVAEAM